MVRPARAQVRVPLADLRAAPAGASELVDQAHHGETVTVLGRRGTWRYVQGEDHYFGWLHADEVVDLPPAHAAVVSVLLATVRERPDPAAPAIAELPAGTALGDARDGWHEVAVGAARAFVAAGDATAGVAQRAPTAADLIATAEAFVDTPYLWGGTTGAGIDCSGFVQQVYRLNGMGLDRDADQQALEGRAVTTARAGDLLFFGAPRVTHVALAVNETDYLHAPQRGGFVERGGRSPERTPIAVRRYLLEDAD